MKKFLLVWLSFFLCFFTLNAYAYKADPFKGVYEILSESQQSVSPLAELIRKPIPKKYFIVDTDTLEKIWLKYAGAQLPADLVKYKDEPSIIAGFTERDLTFLTLERGALISATFMHIDADANTLMEMQLNPGAGADLAVMENGKVSRHLLAPPTPVDGVQKSFAFEPRFER